MRTRTTFTLLLLSLLALCACASGAAVPAGGATLAGALGALTQMLQAGTITTAQFDAIAGTLNGLHNALTTGVPTSTWITGALAGVATIWSAFNHSKAAAAAKP